MDKLYKTVITIEVLSVGDGPYGPIDVRDMAQDITTGGCSGTYHVGASMELSELEMAAALEAQGSDPSFLLGDEWENWESKLHESEEQ